MKVFLAGTGLLKKYPNELQKSKYILESFYSIQEWQIPFLLNADMFLLDSGAFTFMNSKKGKCDFDEYLRKYIEFINKYDIKYFFELDIDSVVGYEQVKRMRHELEKRTQKQCIPVWHKSRGKDEFNKMVKEYKYASIGGIVTKEIPQTQYKYFPSLIETAHRNGCELHGLGFTSTSYYDKVRFDTVDSTTWNVGGKFGNVCKFDPKTLMKQHIQNKGKRCVKQTELMLHNFNEWVKFQKYAEVNL